MNKLIGISVLFFGLLAVIMTYKDVKPLWFESTQVEQIQLLWKQDMELLIRSKSLPKEWLKVSDVKFFPLTETTKELLTQIKPPLGKQEIGDYRLEVTMDDWKDGTDYGLMIQYQLFDIPSENLIWELGRTLIIADSIITEKTAKHVKDKEEVETTSAAAQTP